MCKDFVKECKHVYGKEKVEKSINITKYCAELECEKRYRHIGDSAKPKDFVAKNGKVVDEHKVGKCDAHKKKY